MGIENHRIDEERLLAALCYVGLLIVIPLFDATRNPFVRWHLRQGAVLLILLFLSLVIVTQAKLVGTLLVLGILCLMMIGVVQALLGKKQVLLGVYQLARLLRL